MTAFNIIWDIDEDEINNLPSRVEIPGIVEPIKEDVAKYLLNTFGYCVCGFELDKGCALTDQEF